MSKIRLEEILKEKCKESGISIQELANKIGMSYSGLYSTLKNDTLKVSTLESIAEVLKVSILDIIISRYQVNDGPNFGWTCDNFIRDPQNSIVAERFSTVSEKLDYYKDVFFTEVFSIDDYDTQMAAEMVYPFKHPDRPKYVFKKDNKLKFPDIPLNVRWLPYSKWPEIFKKEVRSFEYLFESFYFLIFYHNKLHIIDYLNEGLIIDSEVLTYYNKWLLLKDKSVLLNTSQYYPYGE